MNRGYGYVWWWSDYWDVLGHDPYYVKEQFGGVLVNYSKEETKVLRLVKIKTILSYVTAAVTDSCYAIQCELKFSFNLVFYFPT